MNKLAFKMILAHISHEKQIALMKFLARQAREMGVSEHSYVVGGAVRNTFLDQPIKDLDIVVDSVSLGGRGSDWFATRLQEVIPAETNLATNQYGVAILTIKGPWNLDGHEMQGEVIEIANARKESYGGGAGKGYKPDTVETATIQEDTVRREFAFNTLLWKLEDLTEGPNKSKILDPLGWGLFTLKHRILVTPSDPNKCFKDDPTRLLRAIKFIARYGFQMPETKEELAKIIGPEIFSKLDEKTIQHFISTKRAIIENAPAMKNAPWEAIGTLLVEEVLNQPTARGSLILMKELGLLDVVREMVVNTKPFEAYLKRNLDEKNVKFLLHMMDLGFDVKSPLSIFTGPEKSRIQAITSKMTEEEAQEFFENVKKPRVDFNKITETLKIKGRDLASVTPKAREILLEKPDLFRSPELWTSEVIRALKP